MAWCEGGNAELLNSVALWFEVEHNPNPLRKAFVQETLAKAVNIIQATEAVEHLARDFGIQGIKPLDALHLACAVEAQADYFCTCDDRFFRRAKQIATGKTTVVSPLELIEAIEP